MQYFKSKLCLFAGFLLVAWSATAQKKAELVYDYNKGLFLNGPFSKNGKPLGLQTGGFVSFRIINVNTFRWKVELTGQNINYVTPIPSELQTLFRLPDQSANQKNTQEALANASAPVEQMKAVAQDVSTSNKDAVAPVTDEEQKLESKMNNLVSVCDDYLKIIRKIATIKFTRVQLINISKQKWESFDQMHENLPPPLSQTDMNDTYNDFSSYYAIVEKAYTEAVKAAKLVRNKANEAFAKSKSNDNKSKLDNATDNLNSIQQAQEDIEKSNYIFAGEDLLKIIEDVMTLQDAMENKSYFEVVSPPIQMHGDFVEFNIVTTPTRTNSLMPFESGKTFPIQVPVKGGLKVDFSVGPIISFGPNSKDDHYFLEETGTSPGSMLTLKKSENKNAITPSLAAMMHFYNRGWPKQDYPIGLMMGIGAGFQNTGSVDANLMGGVSSILGKAQKIMVSLGVSYLRVERLKEPEFKENQSYLPDKIDIGSVTEKVFKPSFFLSLSYNLSQIEIN